MNKKEKKGGPEVENTYTTTITYNCPVRGKVTQVVKVNRFTGQKAPENTLEASEVSELLDSVVDMEDDI